MSKLFFDGWESVGRTALVGALSYLVLLAMLRVTGKRTVAQMNIYDLIVTVALGSTLASAMTATDVVLSDAFVAFLVLAGLQYVVSWLSVRTRWARRIATGEPALLLRRGEPLRDAMRRERVTEPELLAALRAQGIAALEEVEAVVLETDGSFSVLRSGASGAAEGSLRDVPHYG